jgi:hypothetical protein
MRVVRCLILLSACSDYNFTNNQDRDRPRDADDSGGSDGDTQVDPTTCDDLRAAANEGGLEAECESVFVPGTFTPVVERSVYGRQGYGPPVVGQLDDDDGDGDIDARDTPEICWIENTGAGLTCIDGRTAAIEVQTTGGLGYWDPLSGLAIGDVDGDKVPEIVAANGPNWVVAFTPQGAVKWSRTGLSNQHHTFTYPALADLDADGRPEVIVGRVILDGAGQLVGTGAYGSGAVPNASGHYIEGSVPVPADLNGDGTLEVVVGNAAYRKDGSALYTNGLPDGCPAVADFDLDGQPEVVVVSGNVVRTLESDMRPTGWSASFSSNYIGPPAVDDLDGDGRPEFVVQASNEMRAYRWDGSVLWTAWVQDFSGAAGPVLFDFEMDGYPEVVYADEVSVRVFDGRTGAVKLTSTDHASYTGFETPVVADVDNDGEVEIVMLHGQSAYGLTVYGDADHSWPRGRQVWNQHAYSITNVNDDLTIPARQAENWLAHNNFRSGDAGLPPQEWHDVELEIVDVCTDECPAKLALLVRAYNRGTSDLEPGLPISVRAGEAGRVVATLYLPAALPSGWSSEGVVIELDPASLGGERPWVEVDADANGYGKLAECQEGDNAVLASTSCD